MMSLFRKILLFITFYMLAVATSASAECAWRRL